ncbi:hypothetical protein PHMEG_0001402 [Phytophthora megakarya]|uniref:Uncharacterized protein n=1 Tax=Phytophthora megakarya TaxID=4795 RepID=A0A225X1X8_9STRA|nr:hypothetical protein PHMEG_0001402 [Phytophthora megakarya]
MNRIRIALMNLFEKRCEKLASQLLWVMLLDPRVIGMDLCSKEEKIEANTQLLDAVVEVAADLIPVLLPTEAPIPRIPVQHPYLLNGHFLQQGILWLRKAAHCTRM